MPDASLIAVAVATIAAVVATIAAVVSAIAAVLAWKSAQRVVDIEAARRADELAARKVIGLRVEWSPEPSARGFVAGVDDYRCTLVNDGPATAFDVTARVVSRADPAWDLGPFTHGIDWPVAEMRRNDRRSFVVIRVDGADAPFDVHLEWKDADRNPHSRVA